VLLLDGQPKAAAHTPPCRPSRPCALAPPPPLPPLQLPANMSGREKREKMVVWEAAISSSLIHPNLCQTYHYRYVPLCARLLPVWPCWVVESSRPTCNWANCTPILSLSQACCWALWKQRRRVGRCVCSQLVTEAGHFAPVMGMINQTFPFIPC